jgi:Mrp family chromosome partitioning ATPase
VRTKFDIILIDSAPLNETKDSVILAANCDGVVLVINEGGTRKQIVKVALAALLKNKVNVLGAILNNRTYPIPLNIYKRV